MSAKNETPAGELSDFDKRMDAEDPQYLARKAALEALKKHTDAWLSAYEFDDGENFTHSPTELERLLIADAFCGLTGDEEYMRLQSAWREFCPGAAPAGDTTMLVRAWQVRWTATPNEPCNANPWTVLTSAEYRMNPSRDEVELVRKPDAVAALAAKDVEIARLTQCLAGANSQAEEFERKWHLRGHELEGLTVERDAAIAARDSAVKLVNSLNAQLAASRVPATEIEIEIERAVDVGALYHDSWDESVWRAAEKYHGIT